MTVGSLSPGESVNYRIQACVIAVDVCGPLSHHQDPANPSYWFVQEIEPNARGVHEVRQLFWEALERALGMVIDI